MIGKLQEQAKTNLQIENQAMTEKLEEAQDKYDQIQKQVRQKMMKNFIDNKFNRSGSADKGPSRNSPNNMDKMGKKIGD